MQTFSLTDTGRMRTANQDYVFCQDTEIGSFPNLFIVADGMGGHNAGDTASRMCVEEIVSQIQKSTKITPIGIFEQAVAAANEKVYQASRRSVFIWYGNDGSCSDGIGKNSLCCQCWRFKIVCM